MVIVEHLQSDLRKATDFNSEIQVAPPCILWPNKECQWEAVMPLVQKKLPTLIILGDFAPENSMEPAIWLH